MSTMRPLLFHKDQITLKASPQKAWDLFKVFDAIHTWHPATEKCVMLVGENGKPLAVREFQLKGGGFVISELLDYDEHKQWFKYRILKTSLPLHGYVGEMQVVPVGDDSATVLWSAHFQRPDDNPQSGQDDAATEQLVRGVFTAGLENLRVLTAN